MNVLLMQTLENRGFAAPVALPPGETRTDEEESACRDHARNGNFSGYRDCHVEPDLVLVYRIVADRLEVVCFRLGSQADIFGK